MIGRLKRLRAVRRSGESGVSLTELLVSAALFSVVAAIVAGTINTLSGNIVKQANTVTASDVVRSAYFLLDKQARYADAINTPATSNGKLYVEWELAAGTVTGKGTEPGCTTADTGACCVQWRFNPTTGVLDQRSWWADATPSATFTTVGTGLAAPAGSTPVFALEAPPVHQVLDVNLRGTVGAASGAIAGRNGTAALSASFTAYNTTSGTARATPVCNAAANRP